MQSESVAQGDSESLFRESGTARVICLSTHTKHDPSPKGGILLCLHQLTHRSMKRRNLPNNQRRLIAKRLKRFGFKSLKDYYDSVSWKQTRKRVYNSRPYECAGCRKSSGLQLHHKTYQNLCKERLEYLIWLCDTCHKAVHQKAKGTRTLGRMTHMIIG